MRIALLLGFTALLAVQAAAVPTAEPEASISLAARSPFPEPVAEAKKHHNHKAHKGGKQKAHKHKHHKPATVKGLKKKLHKIHRKAHRKKIQDQLSKVILSKPQYEWYAKDGPSGDGICGLPGTDCILKRDVGEQLGGSEEGYCGAPGNPCNTVKRTAWAIADALAGARNVTDSPSFDGAPGTIGEAAEDAIDEIAAKARETYSEVYTREAAALAFAEAKAARNGLCGPAGTPCVGTHDLKARADPETEAYVNDDLGVCGAGDTPCLAVRDPNPDPKGKHAKGDGFCGLPGTFCASGKRNAEAEPKKHAKGDGFCGLPGTFCASGKRSAEAEPKHAKGDGFCGLPGTFCASGKREAAPQPKHAKGDGFCGLPGTFCASGKRDAAPEPVAVPEPGKKNGKHAKGSGFCGLPGTFCAKNKRDALAEPEAEPKKHAHGDGFCGLPGTFCASGKKREAAPEPEAEPKKKHAHGDGFCGLPGTFCASGKKRNAEAEPKKKHAHGDGFCGLPGTFCAGGKKRDVTTGDNYCGFPGHPCVDSRSAKDIVSAVANADPEWLKNECHQNGHACDTIYKIRDAFHQAKREAEELQEIEDPVQKYGECAEEGAEKCGYLTLAHQYAANNNAERAVEVEKRCDAEGGLCNAAKRELEQLESSIDAAVAAIEAN